MIPTKYIQKFSSFLFVITVLGLPGLVFAQRSGGIKELMLAVGRVVNLLIPLAAAAALLFFFWGLVKFIYKVGKGEESAVEEGKEIMKWGIISLFVIVSIWGIVWWIKRELVIPEVRNITTPRDRADAPIPSNPRDVRPSAPGDSDFPTF